MRGVALKSNHHQLGFIRNQKITTTNPVNPVNHI